MADAKKLTSPRRLQHPCLCMGVVKIKPARHRALQQTSTRRKSSTAATTFSDHWPVLCTHSQSNREDCFLLSLFSAGTWPGLTTIVRLRFSQRTCKKCRPKTGSAKYQFLYRFWYKCTEPTEALRSSAQWAAVSTRHKSKPPTAAKPRQRSRGRSAK